MIVRVITLQQLHMLLIDFVSVSFKFYYAFNAGQYLKFNRYLLL